MPAHMREAFTFSLEQRPGQEGEECQAISSFDYTNALVFVEEVNNCATNFKQYVTVLVLSIKIVATDLALGIMWEPTGRPRPPRFTSVGRIPTVASSGCSREAAAPVKKHACSRTQHTGTVMLELELVLETSVPVFPSCLEVLSAHQGGITISNSVLEVEESEDCSLPPGTSRVERFSIQAHHINMTTFNLENKLEKKSPPSLDFQIHQVKAQSLLDSSRQGVLILPNTHLEVTIDRSPVLTPIKGRVMNLLKVSLFFKTTGEFEKGVWHH